MLNILSLFLLANDFSFLATVALRPAAITMTITFALALVGVKALAAEMGQHTPSIGATEVNVTQKKTALWLQVALPRTR